MSDNPFDIFAADFKAAIPSTGDDNKSNLSNQPINIMAQPAPAPVPVMKTPAAPVMNQQPQQSMMGGGMMGNPQPMYNGGMYGNGYGYGGGMVGGAPAPTMGGGPMGAQGAMVPSAQQSNPYALNNGAFGQPPMPYGQQQPPMPQMGQPAGGMSAPAPFGMPSPYGAPPPSQPTPTPAAPAPAPQVSADPFGSAPTIPPAPPAVPTEAPPATPFADPFSAGAPPPQPTSQPPSDPFNSSDPWAAAPPPSNDAIVPVPNGASVDNDPFLVFDHADALSVASPVPQNQYTSEQIGAAADDPWGNTFGNAPDSNNAPVPAPAPVANNTGGGGGSLLGDDAIVAVSDDKPKSGELPPGGEWYDARIFTPTLGVMFFKPQELTDSLFLQTDRSLVDALDDRPVVAFIVEGSSARAAGVELGHVLLKVNGIDVKNPKEASRLIKEGPRPLPLLFYVPDTTVVVAEGEHMVKYDTRETTAPNSAKDWKPKYVVIGGIIAQPWMMNMYRSKSEYDIAVIETQARRPVSVKVKQFSLQGARIQNDWQGPQMVKYKNKLHPWKYIVVLPISRNPIKISSPNLAQLKPVHEGIRRVLMAQNRYAPSSARSDPYGGPSGYSNQYGAPQHQQPPPHQPAYGQQGGGNYGGQQGGGDYGGGYGAPHQQQYGGGYGGQEQYNTAGGTGSARRRTEY